MSKRYKDILEINKKKMRNLIEKLAKYRSKRRNLKWLINI